MRIHLVVAEVGEDQVLSRLAGYLVEGTEWSIGLAPDPTADLNYFFPYILYSQSFPGWHDTPIAAYFSHYDSSQVDKRAWWERAARDMDYAFVTAPQYGDMLRALGKPVALVHAPVDPQFVPKPAQPAHRQPIIGVSGVVYADGRKGEELVQRLVKDLPQFDWHASGRGWKLSTTQWIPWQSMFHWFQELDVYVCTSRLEGVPLPPLEALACGVKVVIPEGVGMLDSLPTTPDIWRYPLGDYAALKAAVQGAAASRVPFSSGDSVSLYTVVQWKRDHLEAFEGWLRPAFNLEAEHIPAWTPANSGVVYIAYGRPARECAQAAIASWKAHMGSIPVALISDEGGLGEDVFCPYPDSDIGARGPKTVLDTLLPQAWQFILYLDADTEVIAPVPFFFDLLERGWELVICKNPVKYHDLRRASRPDNQDELNTTYEELRATELLQLNGGVFALRRNARTRRFMQLWNEEWTGRWAARDQLALLRALWRQSLRVFMLGNEWNLVTRYADPSQSAGILHSPMTARRWSGRIDGRLDSPQAWNAVHKKDK